MDIVITFCQYGGPIALTGLGVAMTFWPSEEPKRRQKRFAWLAIIVLAATVTAYGTYADKLRDDERLTQTEARALGKSYYGYVHLRNGEKNGDKYRTYILGIGHPEGVAIGFYLLDGFGKQVDEGIWLPPRDIFSGNSMFEVELAPAKYRIDFKAKHDNNWREYLTIEERGGRVFSTIEVLRDNEDVPLFTHEGDYKIGGE